MLHANEVPAMEGKELDYVGEEVARVYLQKASPDRAGESVDAVSNL